MAKRVDYILEAFRRFDLDKSGRAEFNTLYNELLSRQLLSSCLGSHQTDKNLLTR